MSWIINNDSFPKQDSWQNLIPVLEDNLPTGVPIINNDFPKFSHWQLLDKLQNPLPQGLFTIQENHNDGFPMYSDFYILDVFQEPLPVGIMSTENGFPMYSSHSLITMGGFYSTKLAKATIPESVKQLGEYTFAESDIKRIDIADDCLYYETTFPEDCIIITK